MQLLVRIMIILGSALMVYNILRYGRFLKLSLETEQGSGKHGLLTVPLLLLVFFLVGYLIVAVSGIADLLMASILLGGSIFVFLLLAVMYSIVRRLGDSDRLLSGRYEEMKEELAALTKDSLAAFRVNLTRDEVEERSGAYLFDSDLELDRYSQLLEARRVHVLEYEVGASPDTFTREGLLKLYAEGQTGVSERLLIRRSDGEPSFVTFEAALRKKPVSGDVVAFLLERPCNEETVRQALTDKVLMDLYDRIAYIVEGKSYVMASNYGKKEGLLLPTGEDSYESLYLNYILPALARDREQTPGQPNPLRLSVIDKALEEKDVYEVNAPFVIDGVRRYKHFSFYRIAGRAKFYLMLLSDSTGMQEEQARQNRLLADALAESERSNASRARFFAGISHDLRTPLEIILRSAAEAREAAEGRPVCSQLEQVEKAGRQLENMMGDLLVLSGAEGESEPVPTDLRALTGKLAERFTAADPQQGPRFRADAFALKEPRVLCDAGRLERILSRLLENSCVFVSAGETVTLTVTEDGEASGGRRSYAFCIFNPGSEIPQEALDRLFDAAAWDESGRAGELPGVRLGMNAAREYAESMGGSIEAFSRPGEGSEFRIRLPLAPAPAEPPAPEAAPAGRRALRVLLVDDNEINREIGEAMLSAEGFTVGLACDGAEAVEKAAGGGWDLILMDVQMPVMGGYEATAKIRALPDPASASVPVVALTANADPESAAEALAAGMDGHAAKPLDPAKLLALIDRLLPDPKS
ncbi:MAG: response regulator [Oscillospiraceae bacterium]|nr:response regulator [Oscillospiraceae bacterium]